MHTKWNTHLSKKHFREGIFRAPSSELYASIIYSHKYAAAEPAVQNS
jgi:hypothetical protein